MESMQIIATLLVILCNGIGAIILARFSKLPLTLCVLIWGMISAVIIPISGFDTGIRASNFQPLIMNVLLPLLVFEAALSIKFSVLKPVLMTVLFAATGGTLIAMLIAGGLLFYSFDYPYGFPVIAAMLAGLVISATDPVAVVNQLKEARAPKKLATLIEGESLFNDATAIVLFGILLAMATGEQTLNLSQMLFKLTTVLIGGVLVGAILGMLTRIIAPLLCGNQFGPIILSLTLAYGSFYVAEHMFHVSGVIAVLVAALISKNVYQREGKLDHNMMHSWESIGFICNLVVFFLMGLVITFDMFTEQWLAMLFGIVAATLSRLFSVYFSIAIGKWVFREALPWHYAPIMIWGGLRGVITLALVLSLPIELPYWWTIQSIGFGVVLFTLVVQATTNPSLVNFMLTKEPDVKTN